jgi:DtxR family Mn-dependent transcriptional regulator
MEDYIEAIAEIKRDQGTVRVKAISKTLGVSAPSVNSALYSLTKLGYVTHERYGLVYLTQKGVAAAKEIMQRHKVLQSFLVDVLGVDPTKAAEEACLMEHAISSETKDKLIKFVESFKSDSARDR